MVAATSAATPRQLHAVVGLPFAAVIETVLAASVAAKVPIERALPLDLQIHDLV